MTVETTTRPFDYQAGGDFPGSRGIILEATRPYAPGKVLSVDFPNVFISDNGDVEFDEGRYPEEDMLEWLDAVAAAIRQRSREQGR